MDQRDLVGMPHRPTHNAIMSNTVAAKLALEALGFTAIVVVAFVILMNIAPVLDAIFTSTTK